jgi:HSP20 family protein
MTTALYELGRTLNRTWESLASGWRELSRAAGGALTRYLPARAGGPEGGASARLPGWGLLPSEIIETGKSVVVQIELPGVDRDDIEVSVAGGMLRIQGDKQADREYIAESYYLRERAYGRFERLIPLPPEADPGGAKASYRRGVLTVELPKTAPRGRRRVTIASAARVRQLLRHHRCRDLEQLAQTALGLEDPREIERLVAWLAPAPA